MFIFLINLLILVSLATFLSVMIGMVAKYVLRKLDLYHPLSDLINIIFLGFTRILMAGITLIILGLPHDTVFISILILLVLIGVILWITGLAENIFTGITYVRKTNIQVGMCIKIYKPINALELKIIKLDLLYLHGKNVNGEIHIIPYSNLQQGFAILVENN